jgi:flagellar FliJ protein
MATQSSSALFMLKDLAAKEVDSAAEALAYAMKVADEAQNKQAMLHEYRKGYVENLNKSLLTGIGTEAYQNFQNFFGKLDQAIAGQLEVVESTKRLVIHKRELWQESQRKKLSYEVLLKRSASQANKAELKKDQKMMDEFAMRISRTGHS